MNGLTADHDTAVQTIDSSIVGLHRHGARIAGDKRTIDGPAARWTDKQVSCARRYQRIGRTFRVDNWRGAGLRLAANYPAFIQFAPIRLSLRADECAP